MLLDILVIVILVISVICGRRSGLFRTVARFLSLALAAVCTSLWGEKLQSLVSATSLYKDALMKLTESVAKAIQSGKTALISPFLGEAGTASIAETVAQSIADTLLSVICFVIFVFLVRIVIEVLDKSVFHLPLLRPLNRFLGMLFSFVFTLAVLYLVVGALGSAAMLLETNFIAEQMQGSVLVRSMYENNIVLNIICGKG